MTRSAPDRPTRPSKRAPTPGAAARSRGALLVALGVDNLGSGLFLPLAVLYTTRVVGLPLSVAGTAVAAGTLIGVLVPPLAGRLVDRVGPRPVVITAQLLQAAGASTYLVAGGVPLVVVAAALLALGQQTFYSSLFALIADVAVDGPRDRPFAIVGMVRSAAFGLGALVAGVFLVGVGRTGLQVAVAVDAASFCVAAAVLVLLVRPHQHERAVVDADAGEHSGSVLTNWPYLTLIAITTLTALTLDVFLVGFPVYLLDELHSPAWLPGGALALQTAFTSTCAAAAVRATQRMSRTTTMAIGAAAYVVWSLAALATSVVPATARPAWVFATIVVLAAANVTFGRANALAEAAAPRASRGRHLAAFQYAFTAAGIAAPAIVSLFAVALWLPWLVVAVSAAVAAVALPRLGRTLPSYAVHPVVVAD